MTQNDALVKNLVFSGGEVHIQLDIDGFQKDLDAYGRIILTAVILNSDDVMRFVMTVNALREEFGNVDISVCIPYMPYSRQDRVCAPGEAFGIRAFGDILNSLNLDMIVTYDAHSDVTAACVRNLVNLPQYELVRSVSHIWPKNKTILVSPDAGANKKTFAFAKELGFSEVIRADKVRDVNTGEIKETKVYHDFDGTIDKDFLIVDDICDGGRTFIELAKVLQPLTTGKVKLLVTHGIFSKGLNVFDGLINEIYVVNVFNELDLDNNLIWKIDYSYV